MGGWEGGRGGRKSWRIRGEGREKEEGEGEEKGEREGERERRRERGGRKRRERRERDINSTTKHKIFVDNMES